MSRLLFPASPVPCPAIVNVTPPKSSAGTLSPITVSSVSGTVSAAADGAVMSWEGEAPSFSRTVDSPQPVRVDPAKSSTASTADAFFTKLFFIVGLLSVSSAYT